MYLYTIQVHTVKDKTKMGSDLLNSLNFKFKLCVLLYNFDSNTWKSSTVLDLIKASFWPTFTVKRTFSVLSPTAIW